MARPSAQEMTMSARKPSAHKTPATPAPPSRKQRDDQRVGDAQAELDQIREQAGGALSGRERAQRLGLDPDDTLADPPLDKRLTARNILLQGLALLLFLAVMGFMLGGMYEGLASLFERTGAR
ncbi:MAG: hypothetical protein MRY63_02770 [Neomegalonema sp.]|nr:hypothetical protein [Neomegalonema sp.]